jgi:Zn-dependent protease with chaperone function
MQHFHDHQQKAQELTSSLGTLLVISVIGTIALSALALAGVAVGTTYAYLAATVHIKMPPEHWRHMFFDRLTQAGVLTTLTVVGVALYKTLRLAEDGGRAVARSLGGTRVAADTVDLNHRKALNVVEEMAIATLLSPPPLYILEDEPGINAFAAGFDRKDTAIGITRGAVERLKRHQLQGVVAHEFSRIVHGDVRLNSRLIGILTGIQSIAFAANYLIRIAIGRSSNAPGQLRTQGHPLGMALALVFGLALWPIGQIGVIFAHLIIAAVNRQREFLADASAVEYTRDPQGLCEALELLREDELGSRLHGPAAQLAGHMFFAGVGPWQRLFHTHPSLEERIRRLDRFADMRQARGAEPAEAEPVLSAREWA